MDQLTPAQSVFALNRPHDVIATWRPTPIVAALLNLVGLGIGHLYAGQVVGGLLLVGGLIVWTFGLLYASCLFEARAVHLGLIAMTMASQIIVAPLLGYRAAQRAVESPRRWYQRWYALLLCWFALLICLSILTTPGFPLPIRAYRQPSVAMVPTLLANEKVFAISDTTGVLHVGDVVVVRRQDGILRIQRVMGLPGDTFEVRDFHAIVNSRPEAPPFGPCTTAEDPATWSDDTRRLANFGPVTVPADQYALLGDCRDQTVDVRFLGFVARSQVVKRVAWIYWSSGEQGLRFNRIGLSVK